MLVLYQIDSFTLNIIKIYNNSNVTTIEHKASKYLIIFFYEQLLLLSSNSYIINTENDVLVYLLYTIISKNLLASVETICAKYKLLIITITDI